MWCSCLLCVWQCLVHCGSICPADAWLLHMHDVRHVQVTCDAGRTDDCLTAAGVSYTTHPAWRNCCSVAAPVCLLQALTRLTKSTSSAGNMPGDLSCCRQHSATSSRMRSPCLLQPSESATRACEHLLSLRLATPVGSKLYLFAHLPAPASRPSVSHARLNSCGLCSQRCAAPAAAGRDARSCGCMLAAAASAAGQLLHCCGRRAVRKTLPYLITLTMGGDLPGASLQGG